VFGYILVPREDDPIYKEAKRGMVFWVIYFTAKEIVTQKNIMVSKNPSSF